MVSLVIFGAGKSSAYLIEYALKNTKKRSGAWQVTLADGDENVLLHKTRNYPNAKIQVIDIANASQRQKLVKDADVVVSLMPPHLHILLAKDCLQFKKNLITSSYVSDEMRELDQKAKEAGLMFMCEMGLDPGLDHMSATAIFDSIHKVGSDINSYKSYCGGLVAPESDDNQWHYKFSWNPMNVINAGKNGGRFLRSGKEVHQTYEQLFSSAPTVRIDGVGDFAYYANRNSIDYISKYDLGEAKDFMRATLRHPDFIKVWSALIAIGLTENTKKYNTDKLTNAEWIKSMLGYNDTNKSVAKFVFEKFGIKDAKLQKMLDDLGIFEPTKILKGENTAGEVLYTLLEDKWKMKPTDKDMVVMHHEIEYAYKGDTSKLTSSLVVIGENAEFTAMAKTVGLPIYALTEMCLAKSMRLPTGVLIPTMSEIYRPVLNRLRKYGIEFSEKTID